jgi:hypothetical protein
MSYEISHNAMYKNQFGSNSRQNLLNILIKRIILFHFQHFHIRLQNDYKMLTHSKVYPKSKWGSQ